MKSSFVHGYYTVALEVMRGISLHVLDVPASDRKLEFRIDIDPSCEIVTEEGRRKEKDFREMVRSRLERIAEHMGYDSAELGLTPVERILDGVWTLVSQDPGSILNQDLAEQCLAFSLEKDVAVKFLEVFKECDIRCPSREVPAILETAREYMRITHELETDRNEAARDLASWVGTGSDVHTHGDLMALASSYIKSLRDGPDAQAFTRPQGASGLESPDHT